MSTLIKLNDVSYTYPLADTPVLDGVSLQVECGEFVLVVGESGAGKSTLLRTFNGLVPHFYGGRFSGDVEVAGHNTRTHSPRALSHIVGFVFQDPEGQFVTDRVEDELAFGLENTGVPPAEMRPRIDETCRRLQITHLRDRQIRELSGGEKQRVAIASVLTVQPQALILDEPTSQLDPVVAEELLLTLLHLNRELGLTIVLAEHRLERVAEFADRVLYVPAPGIRPRVAPPREIFRDISLAPPVTALGKALDWRPLPLSVPQGRRFAAGVSPRCPARKASLMPNGGEPPCGDAFASDPPAIVLDAIRFSYEQEPVLRDIDLTIRTGEFVALMGPNGSGKSTVVRHLVGLLRPDHGRVLIQGQDIRDRPPQEICRHVGYLPQDPNALLFAETVAEEPMITLSNHGLSPERAPIAPDVLLQHLGLHDVVDAYPRDLSAGQRERVALSAVLITRPPIIILDEPTRGLDIHQKLALIDMLKVWQDEGATILLVTHDVEIVATAAERVVILEKGCVVADGATRPILGESPIFAPQVARLFDRSDLLTVNDVLAAIA